MALMSTRDACAAARRILSDWWLLLPLGLAKVPLGVLALANPGTTLAAIITVGGIWAAAVGVMRIVYAFELRRLPKDVGEAFADHGASKNSSSSVAGCGTCDAWPRRRAPFVLAIIP